MESLSRVEDLQVIHPGSTGSSEQDHGWVTSDHTWTSAELAKETRWRQLKK